MSSSLRELTLAHCWLTDDAARPLEAALRESKSLKRLQLAGNAFTSAGAGMLAKALWDNARLQALDLSENPIGDGGVEALLRAASGHNSTLTQLGLRGVRADWERLEALVLGVRPTLALLLA